MVLLAAIDIAICAQTLRELLFRAVTRKCDVSKAHLFCFLESQMNQSTGALDCNFLARIDLNFADGAERVEDGHASAEGRGNRVHVCRDIDSGFGVEDVVSCD